MKNVFVVISCLLLGAFLGCQRTVQQSDLIEINIEENIKNVKLLNICDFNCEIEYIPIKQTPVTLRSVYEIDFSDDYILISDRNHCFLIDYQGNIVAKIGAKGKGPGEYTHASVIKFGISKQIFIQSGWYLHVYDLKGKFLRKFKIEANPKLKPDGIHRGGQMYSWAPFNDSLFIGQVNNDSGQEKYKAVFFDETGRTLKAVENHVFRNLTKPYTASNNYEANIYKKEGQTFFKERMNDTVFKVNEQYEFIPIYFINQGKYGMPKEILELPMKERAKKTEDYISVSNVFESSKYLFLTCSFNNYSPAKRTEPILLPENLYGPNRYWSFYPAGMLGIFDKHTKELVFAEPVKSDNRLTNSGLRNDYDGGVNFYPIARVNDSTLALKIDAYQLKEHVASKTFKNSTPKYPEKKKELERLANSLSEEDNPVLMLFTFKGR